MQLATNGQQPVPAEDEWVYCELVHAGVQQMKTLEAQEVAIQAQLEAVRCKKQTVKAHTLEALSPVLQVSAEDAWEYCELVHDGVEQMNALKAQEANLQAQLETIHSKQQEVKAHTLEALSHALQALPVAR